MLLALGAIAASVVAGADAVSAAEMASPEPVTIVVDIAPASVPPPPAPECTGPGCGGSLPGTGGETPAGALLLGAAAVGGGLLLLGLRRGPSCRPRRRRTGP